jgi:NADH-quinone oxidoreductase subunit J
MTTSPRPIGLDRSLLPGLIAIALFVIMAAIFLGADATGVFESAFADPEGFADVSIVSGIGYALLGNAAAAGSEAVYQNTESFLVALILVSVLLDAALDGALMLAKRDDGGEQ